jgi:quinol monooxygenase YgiN
MLIVHVDVHVKPEHVEGFRRASRRNAEISVQEPGVARFDVIQSMEDATRFVLVEVYRSEAAAAQHKETAHYKEWRDAVADMMAEPRQGKKYSAVCPDVSGWP